MKVILISILLMPIVLPTVVVCRRHHNKNIDQTILDIFNSNFTSLDIAMESTSNTCKIGHCSPIQHCNMTSNVGVAAPDQQKPQQSGNRTYNIDLRYGGIDENDACPMNEVCCPPGNKMDGVQCGIRNVKGVGYRISTGEETEFGEFPWTVAILNANNNSYYCGGSLVDPFVVMTVAHCVQAFTAGQLKIRAGEWDTQTENEIYPFQDRYVTSITIHENYTRDGAFNDIALLVLREPVSITENVNVICLPPQDYEFKRVRCFASGWGKNIRGKIAGEHQTIMRSIELPIVARDECEDTLQTTRLGTKFSLHKSFICAGGEQGRDTCDGDGGSPLVCPVPGTRDQYYQAGIVSWGINCGDEQVPGVYTKVSLFRHWIDSKIAAAKIAVPTKIYFS